MINKKKVVKIKKKGKIHYLKSLKNLREKKAIMNFQQKEQISHRAKKAKKFIDILENKDSKSKRAQNKTRSSALVKLP